MHKNGRNYAEEKTRQYIPLVFLPKTCVVCSTLFIPKSGVNKFCSPSCKGKWKYITGASSTENQYKKISGHWDRYLPRLIHQHGRSSLTYEILVEVLQRQEYKCALSGVSLTCLLEKGNICKTNASIDRVIPGGPYTKENIQLVCRALNSWRSDTNLTEFIWWCQKVSKFHGEEEQNLES